MKISTSVGATFAIALIEETATLLVTIPSTPFEKSADVRFEISVVVTVFPPVPYTRLVIVKSCAPSAAAPGKLVHIIDPLCPLACSMAVLSSANTLY